MPTPPPSCVMFRMVAASASSVCVVSNWKLESSSTHRSEERRVGKECRSLCDWSSDVCSSDLDADAATILRDVQDGGGVGIQRMRGFQLEAGKLQHPQIGRASCRERV